MAILKHDLCTGTRLYWSKTDVYVGEPFFIPRAGASDSAGEDDGLVVFVALDGPRGRSMFVTLDAHTMTVVDGTQMHLDRHIAFTAHGSFFAGKQ